MTSFVLFGLIIRGLAGSLSLPRLGARPESFDMQTEVAPDQSKRSPVVDAHTHIFCWGENPKEGFLSEQTRSSRVTRLCSG